VIWRLETNLAVKTVASAVSSFGASAKAKLSNVAITGAPEDQLRGPLEALLHDLADIGGLRTQIRRDRLTSGTRDLGCGLPARSIDRVPGYP
jgi:hypothetical protein